MSQLPTPSYHARGKGLPATVGHMPCAANHISSLNFERWAFQCGFGRHYVMNSKATIWRERVPLHADRDATIKDAAIDKDQVNININTHPLYTSYAS